MFMKLTKTLLATTALTVAAGTAVTAQDMANSMTIVSWGGAYQASQDKAYVQPYLAANPGVTATWDESSAEAVAKLRAMNEAGNIT
ncbi:MAG TPA: spermidine/putrescine ABC transporter substrate-binding protein, partial [Hyphomonas atlantica]|nr:spermidine/putrescine ABC transporter substrate-binding protein [Hyphomonas atlantica]